MRRKWILWYAICTHVGWAWALLLDARALGASPVFASSFGLSADHLVLALAGSSGLALWSIFDRDKGPLWRIAALIPQQAILTAGAIGAMSLAVAGHYADGVPRPHLFIFCDQFPAVVAAALHTVSLVEHAWMHHR